MKNDQVILINGFGRGGTNIVWNLLQSHPSVCSALYETGEILYPMPRRRGGWGMIRRFLADVVPPRAFLRRAVGNWVDSRLFELKLRNLDDPDNRFKAEGVLYSREEVAAAALCLKSINEDIALTRFFASIYPDLSIVGVLRNGYALCDGWTRRGKSAREIARLYRRYGEMMIEDSARYPRYRLIRFEDVLADPFRVSAELNRFAGLEPAVLDRLRLKSKRVVSESGRHEARYGEENVKYWFDRETIQSALDASIDRIQVGRMTDEDRAVFEKEAKPVLDHFGYAWADPGDAPLRGQAQAAGSPDTGRRSR